MDKKSSGRIWPYVIGGAVTLVFGFCVATIIVTSKADVQKSNAYMTYYQDADAKANDFIMAKIKFDKKYNLSYINNGINQDLTTLSYKITDKKGNPVKDAKLLVSISRPDTHEFDKKLDKFTQKDGIYTFSGIKLEKPGKWDIMLKVTIGNDYRFLNIKADTRNKKYTQF